MVGGRLISLKKLYQAVLVQRNKSWSQRKLLLKFLKIVWEACYRILD